ncbi:MAG: hypothetical protein KGH75_00265 [Rhodospirillales bacterium]|nr:hypothetical protein [Rhodospirillales bacterium]
MIPTDGTWDPSDRHIYFLAASLSRQQWACVNHGYVLLAVNDLTDATCEAVLEPMLDGGTRVLLDSGIFWLTNEHKRRTGMSMNEALALAPTEIEGFDALWQRYVTIVGRYGSRVWGTIELDQGGAVNKRKTRAKLRDLGINPMPVYHPLNDGAEYFDELAEETDRFCMGNVVQADRRTRVRLLASLWERHRKYPDLWVHVLGLTPNQVLNAYPCDSADSSTWLNVVRWAGYGEKAMLRPVSPMDPDYKYVIGDTADDSPSSDKRSLAMSAAGMTMNQLGWRHWQDRIQEGLDLPCYPAP